MNVPFQEKNLTFWQLGTMLSAGFGLTSMMVGAQISKNLGAGAAIPSILVGNFILWFIGLVIVAMTNKRAHAIQNIKDTLGWFSAVAAIILVAAFLIWYALQIQAPTDALTLLIKKYRDFDASFELRISAALGLFCALISIGGIEIIKWINSISFPVLVLLLLYILFKSDHLVGFNESWTLSWAGVLLIVLTWLPGTVNLSSFFRHSRSKADSFLGLSIMLIFHTAFQCCFVALNIQEVADLFTINGTADNPTILLAVISFVLISFFCVNLLNIYWASIGWEVFFGQRQESKGYAVIGLLGTVIYVFFQSSTLIALFETIGTVCITNLGVILMAGYLMKLIIHHRLRTLDKWTNSICWLGSCTVPIILLSMDSSDITRAATAGIVTCLLCLGTTLLLEENVWSFKNLLKS